MPKLRILLDCSSASSETGGNVQLCLTIAELAALDEQVELLIVANRHLSKILSARAAELVVFECHRPASSFLNYLHWLSNTRKLIREYKPDFIVYPYGPAYAKFPVPTLMGFAEPWEAKSDPRYLKICSRFEISKSIIRRKIQTFFYKKSDLIWAETKSGLDYFCSISGYDIKNTKVITNSVPEPLRAKKIKRSTWRFSTEMPFKMLYVAAPYRHKNHQLIIDVVEKFEDLNVEFHVTLPQRQPQTIKFEAQIKRKNLQRKIINHGYVSPNKLESVYEFCDAVFMPSIAEVFSAAYLEAMHFSRPVLCSDLPFAHDVMGSAGIYFDPWSVDSAYEKIKLCMSDRNVYEYAVAQGGLRLAKFDTALDKYEKMKNMISDFLVNR
jgi:glycosyltransferase involved in cell wall biosynthesis